MPDKKTSELIEDLNKLRSLSREEVVAALDDDEPQVVQAITALIQEYSEKAAASLQEGGDYLPVLTPAASHSPLECLAMEIVLDVFDEEMEDL